MPPTPSLDKDLAQEIKSLREWVEEFPRGVLTRSEITVLFTALDRRNRELSEIMMPLREFLEHQLDPSLRRGQQTGLLFGPREIAKRALDILDTLTTQSSP